MISNTQHPPGAVARPTRPWRADATWLVYVLSTLVVAAKARTAAFLARWLATATLLGAAGAIMAAAPAVAAAQVGVAITPANGTFTSSSLAVTVVLCDPNTGLDLPSTTITLNGTSVIGSFSKVSWHCPDGVKSEKYTGTVTLAPGANTLVATGYDPATGTGSGTAYDTLVMVKVTPKGTWLSKASHQTTTQTFTVQNLRSSSITFNLTPVCSVARSCTAPSQTTVSANSSGNVNVTYDVPPVADTDSVKIRVASTSFPSDVDTGKVTVVGTAPLIASFANLNNDDQQIGLCAASCFAPALAHSSVGYRSLGSSRTVTLEYHGDRSTVRPILTADLTLPVGSPVPTDITLSAKVSGATQHFVNGDSIVHFSTASIGTSTQYTYRIAAEDSVLSMATGMYPLQVTVTAYYADGLSESYTTAAGTKLMVVNLNDYDILPRQGWTVAGVQRLYKQPDSTVLIVEGDGSGVYFSCKMMADSSCAGPSGDFSRLKNLADTGYWRGYPDSSVAIFGSTGKMKSLRDRWGNKVAFTYDVTSGYLSTIADPFLSSYFALVDSSGVLRIAPPGPNGGLPGTSRRTSFAYDGSRRITTITDPDGRYEQYGYDAAGRLDTVINRRGDVTTYGYDATTWKLTSITLPAVPIDQGGGTTLSQSPVLHFKPWQTIAVPVTSTSSTAAPMARLDTAWALTIGAIHDTVRFTADRWGQLLMTRDPLGNTASIKRTGLFPTLVIDALGDTSVYVYSGAFLTSVQPHGQTSPTDYEYDAWGMLKQVSAPAAPVVQTTYDSTALGRTIVSTIGGAYPDSTYLDSRGRPTRHADPNHHWSQTFYDATFGNADSMLVHDTATVNDMARTALLHDAYGRDSLMFGDNTPVTKRVRDVMGRDSLVYANPGAQPTRFTYDGMFLIRIVDPKGQVFKTDVNALGWPTAIHDPADTTKARRFFYDSAGRVSMAWNRAGDSVAMTHDVAGRVTWKRGYSARDSVQYVYGYSATGQVISGITEDLSGTAIAADTLFADYNGADSSVSWVAGKRFSRKHTATGIFTADTTRYRYTDASNINVAGVPVNNRVRNWSSTTGKLSSIVIAGETISFGYDGELLLNSMTYPNYILTLTHNEQHLTTLESYNVGAVDSLLGRQYVISPFGTSGRIAGEWWRSGVDSLGFPAYTTRGFDYDTTGALSQYQPGRTQRTCGSCNSTIVIDTASFAYRYDGAYNPTSEYNNTTGITTYDSVGAANRLDSLGGVWYDYDADGNRTDKRVSGVYTYYKWNAEGQLVGITSGSSSVWYDYSAFGALLRRKTNGTVDRQFLWDDGQLVLEVDGAGTSKIAEYAYSGTDKPLAVWEGTNSAPYFYSHDERGNITGLTSGSSVLESRHFSPWGVEEFGVSIPENSKFGWKGLPFEAGIANLYYDRARWYDPQSRGFLSEDPIGLAGAMNTYAYADNDVVNGWDPTGLDHSKWRSDDCDAGLNEEIVVNYNWNQVSSTCVEGPGGVYTIGGGNEGAGEPTDGDAPLGNMGGGPTGTPGNEEQPKGCSAARAYAGKLGKELSHDGRVMITAGVAVAGGSLLVSLLGPETAPFVEEGGVTAVEIIEVGGKASTVGSILEGYAEGGGWQALHNGVLSVGIDHLGEAYFDLVAPALGEEGQAAAAAVLGQSVEQFLDSLKGEGHGCAGK